MNPWDLFLLVSLTVIFQKPLKAILKTDQENKPWMKIQPTCQPQPWRAVRESPPHKKHGVFTQKAWGWGRDARTVIFMLRVERKASCVHGALSSQVEEATWQEPHSATALESSHFSFWLFFFPSVVWRNQMIYEQTLQHLQMKSGENFWMTFEMVWHI